MKRNRIRREARRLWFEEFVLKGLVCSKCPEDDICCLDFHHIDPNSKSGEVKQMLNSFRSKESILAEIKKCIVVCSNCHRKIHAGRIII